MKEFFNDKYSICDKYSISYDNDMSWMKEIGAYTIFNYDVDENIESLNNNIQKKDIQNARVYLLKDIITNSIPKSVIDKAIKIIDKNYENLRN
jgi:hypothetical protein